MVVPFLCAIVSIMAGDSVGARSAPAADIRGLYVIAGLPLKTSDVTDVPIALGLPSVDGLMIVIDWNYLEPGDGCFQWMACAGLPDDLDAWIANAIASGKKVELAIRSDKQPGWLYDAGAEKLSLPFLSQSLGCVTDFTLAPPWDHVFLNRWSGMLHAVSDHLRHTVVGGMREYDAIPLLRLTGVDRNSDELHLPAEDQCGSTIETWQTHGYTPSRLLGAWNRITSAFGAAFPDKDFSVAIIDSTFPFPPIDDHGQIIADTTNLSVIENAPLLTLASRKFPGHLVIQNNSLYRNEPARAETISFGTTLGSMTAFQTNLQGADGTPPRRTGGAACTDISNLPCQTSADYLALLTRGVSPAPGDPFPVDVLRAQYIELFAPDAANATYGSALLAAHHAMTDPPVVALTFFAPAEHDGWHVDSVLGIVTVRARPGDGIAAIDCSTASGSATVKVSDRTGLGSSEAEATIQVDGQGSPVVAACVATTASGETTLSYYPLFIDTERR